MSSSAERLAAARARAVEDAARHRAADAAEEAAAATPLPASSVTPQDETAYPYESSPRKPPPRPAVPLTASQQRLAAARARAAEDAARHRAADAAEEAAERLGPDIATRQPPITTQTALRTTPAVASDGIRLLVDGVNPGRLAFTVKMIVNKQTNSSTGAAAVMSSDNDVHPAASHNSPAGEVQDLYRDPRFRALFHQFVQLEQGNYDAVDSLVCGLLGMLNSDNKSRQTQARTGLLLIVDAMLSVPEYQKLSILLKMKDLLSDAAA